MQNDITNLLTHPLVLRAAWRRVDGWYKAGEWTPEPEYAHWKLDPDSQLVKLAKQIEQGYRIEQPYHLLPYPKKGGILRHYCMPSVRDQVVFSAFGILLAPLLEMAMPNFSFGNRWYQAIYRKRSGDHELWEDRPFTLRDKHFYQPYRRGHGLFRRVCHWSAKAMLYEPGTVEDSVFSRVRPEEYPESRLPTFVDSDWWHNIPTTNGEKRGYWGRLDIQLAYPSVDLNYLHNMLVRALRPESSFKQFDMRTPKAEDVISQLRHYPEDIADKLKFVPIQIALATSLVDLLKQVRYDNSNYRVSQDIWKPPHTTQHLPDGTGEGHPGIPTGLTISGLLMNTYLYGLDSHMANWLSTCQSGNQPAAFLRFADDMVLLAPSHEQIIEGIDRVWEGLAGTKDSFLSNPTAMDETPGSNLRINVAKLEPGPLQSIVGDYLKDQGWSRCEGCELMVIPPTHTKQSRRTLLQWFNEPHAPKDLNILTKKWEKQSLERNRLDHFVTHLVERLSDLGSDTLIDRFGSKTGERLTHLHELIRFNLDDHEVRADTRLAFAVNHLTRAWLPETSIENDRLHIVEIRRSIKQALLQAPWKFKLWRSVVRAAARRPLAATNGQETNDDGGAAIDWLSEMLLQIADTDIPGSWQGRWPEDSEISTKCWEVSGINPETRGDWKPLTLSFIRAEFWRVLGQTIHALQRTIECTSPQSKHGATQQSWNSDDWTFRCLPENELAPVQDFLGNLEKWTGILYPPDSIMLTRLEGDALISATLATIPAEELLKVLEPQFDSPILPHPDMKQAFDLSSYGGKLLASETAYRKLVQSGHIGEFPNSFSPWALLHYSRKTPSSRIAIGKAIKSTFHRGNNLQDKAKLLPVARNMGVSHYLPGLVASYWKKNAYNLLGKITKKPVIQKTERFQLLLQYAQARKLALSWKETTTSRTPTLHRLLWGTCWKSENLETWNISPSVAPVHGLPIRVALRFLRDSLHQLTLNENNHPNNLAVWQISEEYIPLLSAGRRLQLGWESTVLDVQPSSDIPFIKLAWGPDYFEIPPHPAFFLSACADLHQLSDTWEQVFHQILYFFMAVTGSEHYLDGLLERGPSIVPFEERWALRARIHLPSDIWHDFKEIEQWWAFGSPFGKTTDNLLAGITIPSLIQKIDNILEPGIELNDFKIERIDISLQPDSDFEFPVAVKAMSTEHANAEESAQINPDGSTLAKTLHVRIGQLEAHPDWKYLVSNFPRTSRLERQQIMRQVWAVFQGEDLTQSSTDRNSSALIVMPELSVPYLETPTLIQLARKYNHAVVAGLLWQPLPSAIPAHASMATPYRFFVNEALIAIPVKTTPRSTIPLVRHFTIRKPQPAHIEYGLADALTKKSGGSQTWQIMPGTRWYRFIHPEWGDFSVAICSDLLDTTPWSSMRGQLLHLFQCAFNKDIDLFESLTWVRAYENYVNMVSVNHGKYGGSFVWTPKHSHSRELARLRGNKLLLTADIDIPVQDLWEKQKTGIKFSRQQEMSNWLGKQKPKKRGDFKSPPPSFRDRRKGTT